MASTMVPIPITNGRSDTTFTPLVGKTAVDTGLEKWTARFDQSVKERLHFAFWMPANYLSGNVTLRLRWRARTATSGDVVWGVGYIWLGDGDVAGTPSSPSTATVTTTTNGTAGKVNESVLTVSSPAANKLLIFYIERTGTSGSDTMTTDKAELLDIILEYTSDPSITKNYAWIPANAFSLPSGTLVTLDAITAINGADHIFPYALIFTNASGNNADAHLNLPSNFSGSLKLTTVICAQQSVNTLKYHIDQAAAADGAASDPALTTGATWTSGAGGGTFGTIRTDLQRAAAVSPNALDEFILRVVRDSSDSSTTVDYFMGVGLEWAVTQQNPGSIRLEPVSGTTPGSGGGTQATTSDSNTSKNVLQLVAGADKRGDYHAHTPSIYSAGGTLRIRWRANAASGNAYLRVDTAWVASGDPSDPSLTSGSAFAAACGGANVINTTTVDISSGATASKLLYAAINRLGSNGSDTLSATAEILDVTFEANIS